MAFQGYLFAVKVPNTNNYINFPMKYIAFDKWSSTPKQREEVKAWRDDNTRELFRITAQGKKSVFQFTTRENLTDKDVEAILNFFTANEVNTEQRKVYLKYWNEESRAYSEGYFYRPNMPFKIKTIRGNTIIYEALTIDCIEY